MSAKVAATILNLIILSIMAGISLNLIELFSVAKQTPSTVLVASILLLIAGSFCCGLVSSNYFD